MTEFEKCLRYGRKEKKLTQKDLADHININTKDIIKLESGFFVFLDDNTIRRVAFEIGMDTDMFLAMYRSTFRQELRTARIQREDGMPTVQSEKDAEGTLSPDLVELGKTIMAMPAELRDCVVQTIRTVIKLATPPQ